MEILMTRSEGRIENLRTRDNLVRVLYATNKKSGSKAMTMAQCSKVADKVLSGQTSTFCGRNFEVRV